MEARNANYATICRQLTFISRAWFEDEGTAALAAGPAASAGHKSKLSLSAASTQLTDDAGASDSGDDDSSLGGGGALSSLDPAAPPSPAAPFGTAEDVAVGEGMRGAQMLVWLGDFNYRIDGGYEAVKERAIRNELGPLLELVRCMGSACMHVCLC